ncbi:MAG: sigma-70 family RNA polymerase sigma factor [Terrimesophilobacter sp.]
MQPELAPSFRQVFAMEWPRVVGAILRSFGDLELAEDSAQEAFLRVHARLVAGDTINNLGAWVTTSARRIAIDALRRDRVLRTKLPMLAGDAESDSVEAEGDTDAELRLRLIVVACNPVLSEEQQIALALRIVCGIPTTDIADFFETPEATIAARLTRARKAISKAGVPFQWPTGADRADRLNHVLTTIFGIYTLGHTAPRGSTLVDLRLIDLAVTLSDSMVSEYPNESEVLGLKALILLGEGRRPARIMPDGVPVALANADRSAWGHRRIREGLELAAKALPGGGRFALQAGIAGIHSSARTWEDTDWASIATLYHGLKRVWPAPVVQLGSIVADSHRGHAELDRAARELVSMRQSAGAEFRRRVSAAIADVEERRGNLAAARSAIADAATGERNTALVDYFTRSDARLATLLAEMRQ